MCNVATELKAGSLRDLRIATDLVASFGTEEARPCLEAYSPSASQEISRLLWNTKVHRRVHKSPPLVPILSQMSPDHKFLLLGRFYWFITPWNRFLEKLIVT
jgi:hypothetical protein